MDTIKNKISFTLSIIIPVYNECNTIKTILDKIENQKKIKKQLIIIDDYSHDSSYTQIKNYNFISEYKILRHKFNQGKGACIKTAKRFVTGDIVIIQDADLEYDPKDYMKLIKPILNRKTNVVYGSRLLKNKYSVNFFSSNFRALGNKFLTFFSNLVNNQNLTDAHTCYKVIKNNIFQSIDLKENSFAFCPEITTKLSKKKEKIIEIPISYHGRNYEEGKKIGFYDAIDAIKALLKYKFL